MYLAYARPSKPYGGIAVMASCPAGGIGLHRRRLGGIIIVMTKPGIFLALMRRLVVREVIGISKGVRIVAEGLIFVA